MKLNETKKVDTNLYELNITVDGEQYAKALDASFKKNASKLNIPGFRKGKAPKSIVYKMVGESYFYEDAINSSYGDAYEEALKESGLEAVAYPEVELKESKGVYFDWLADKMLEKGAVEALNLDGGGTVALVFMGEILNKTGKGEDRKSVV